jgi:hypothetical protein
MENSLFKIKGLPYYNFENKRYCSIELESTINNKILKELIYGIAIQLVEISENKKIDNLEMNNSKIINPKNVQFENGDSQYIVNLMNLPSTMPILSFPLKIRVFKPTTFCLVVELCCKGGVVKNGGYSKSIAPITNCENKSMVYLEQNLYELNIGDIL